MVIQKEGGERRKILLEAILACLVLRYIWLGRLFEDHTRASYLCSHYTEQNNTSKTIDGLGEDLKTQLDCT